ncbi:hypothetical protein [Agathobaculum sp.]|uniref:hypothetical protein n=1 Tax=Agathobaculum sp. TaxID=2048138 RepID=UPI0025BF76CF|nr:hypothetical protein [Agathobaculum sp.]
MPLFVREAPVGSAVVWTAEPFSVVVAQALVLFGEKGQMLTNVLQKFFLLLPRSIDIL